MNAIIESYEMNLGQKIMNFFGFFPFKKDFINYNENKVIVYYFPKNIKKNINKVKKIIQKDNVKKIYFKEKQEKLYEILASTYEVLSDCEGMNKYIKEIVHKIIKSIGISKEKVALGVYVSDGNYDIIKKLETLQSYLKCLYIYGKITPKTEYIREMFFKKTGIPVILKEIINDEQCEIVVLKNEYIKKLPNDIIKIIDLTQKLKGEKIISGVRLVIPSQLKNVEIPHLILSELFNEKFEIKTLLT